MRKMLVLAAALGALALLPEPAAAGDYGPAHHSGAPSFGLGIFIQPAPRIIPPPRPWLRPQPVFHFGPPRPVHHFWWRPPVRHFWHPAPRSGWQRSWQGPPRHVERRFHGGEPWRHFEGRPHGGEPWRQGFDRHRGSGDWHQGQGRDGAGRDWRRH